MDEIKVDAYAFDLDAIFDFVFKESSKAKSSEIRQVYDKSESTGDLELVQKSMAEVKTDELNSSANIRYDFLKLLIDEVSSISITDEDISEKEEDENVVGTPYVETLGQMMAINTLQEAGIIINLATKNLKDDGE